MRVAAYQHGIYPCSEEVVTATRGLERGRTDRAEVDAAFAEDRADFVAAQREAGLDYSSHGLLTWQDLFRPIVEASAGLEARTLLRWFDNNTFFRAPEVTGQISLGSELPRVYLADDEVPRPRVATLPSPFLFSRAAKFSGDRDALMKHLAREILTPIAAAMASNGYDIVHLQEPWLAYFGIETESWDDFEKALTELREGIPNGTTVILHTYFGDVGPLLDRIRRLPVDAVGVDLVETDPSSTGMDWETGLLAGCLDGRSSQIETADAVVDRVLDLADRTGAPRLFLSSSCELEFLPRDLARKKVLRLGEIRRRIAEELS